MNKHRTTWGGWFGVKSIAVLAVWWGLVPRAHMVAHNLP